jgi:putative transposase
MQWLLTSHVRRYHKHYGSGGHVWQGRFKAFPIQSDSHLLTVWRYVERNAKRAGMVRNAGDWRWCSLAAQDNTWLAPSIVDRPADWSAFINETEPAEELLQLRQCIQRGAPYGSPRWTRQAAVRLGLESSLRPRGRPPKPQEK